MFDKVENYTTLQLLFLAILLVTAAQLNGTFILNLYK